MPRAATGLYAAPTNSFNPAVAATVIDPDDFNEFQVDLESVLNEDIYCVLASNYTLTDSATAQKAFNASTNGTFAVAATTTYLIKGEYLITNTGATSHTWAVLFALTTATFTSAVLRVRGRTGITGASTFTADLSGYTTDPTTALVCTAASTANPEHVIISFNGIFRVNAAGTITPQVKLSAQANGTQTMLANSWFLARPLGSNTVATRGTWT